MKLTYFGAAKAVTGSCHCVEVRGKKILIDCGLQQGKDERDNTVLDFAPNYIDYVIVTHAHIDHSGPIPLLIKQVFQGQIFATRLTGELMSIMLQDSAHIQEMDAQWKNQKGKRAGRPPVEPLYTVAAVDLGIKGMTPHRMAERGCRVHVVPSTITFDELQSLNPDGVFFSNGPGDPEQADPEVNLLRQVLDAGYPFFGICFGNQLLGRALGFGTYKLKFGHRGINQPVKDMTTGKIEITAHNHGFAVDAPIGETVDAPFENGKYGKVFVSHIDLNDNVVEGLQCVDIPAFSVQYHPEAAAGPHDAAYLFDRFVDLMRSAKEGTHNA